jgi:hypothetical protein
LHNGRYSERPYRTGGRRSAYLFLLNGRYSERPYTKAACKPQHRNATLRCGVFPKLRGERCGVFPKRVTGTNAQTPQKTRQTPLGVTAYSSGCEPRDYSKHPNKQEKPRQG